MKHSRQGGWPLFVQPTYHIMHSSSEATPFSEREKEKENEKIALMQKNTIKRQRNVTFFFLNQKKIIDN